ncbi:MAG: hypothetical protein NT013_15680 [Planctomycetia bacterium]|nr:hypothetical protein [Planctomycetia bacterium]
MIDDRFSKSEFESLGRDSAEARKLADLLAGEVLHELHEVLAAKLDQIVIRLNAIGHSLRAYELPCPGDVSFRDDREVATTYECDLRLAVDVVVSTGYSHLTQTSCHDEDDDGTSGR